MKKTLITLFIIQYSIPYLAFAQNLKADLHKKAKKNHSYLSYKDVKLVMFSKVENIDGIVCSVYTKGQCQERDQREYVPSIKKRDPRGFKLNLEHTWPQSKGAKTYPAKSDMHHLFAASKESNSKRSNLPFCIVESSFWELGGSALGIDYNSQDCFEPRDQHKGNVARAMFYFSVRYQLPIDSEQEHVLRNWHELDPVDDRETERNLVIQSIQGNINPFIMKSDLVNQIKDF